MSGSKASTSQNWAVWVQDYLTRYDPDPLRYYLSINMPETGDADFSWVGFVRRNNDELVATYGNLVHRVLSFTYRNFDGLIPGPGPLSPQDQGLLDMARTAMDDVDKNIHNCRFKAAIGQAFTLARDANRYLDMRAPWLAIKTDKQDAATSLWVSIAVINCLKVMLFPFLPFSSQQLHEYLGLDGRVEDNTWDFDDSVGAMESGRQLRNPAPLYTKLDPQVVDEEVQRLGGKVVQEAGC